MILVVLAVLSLNAQLEDIREEIGALKKEVQTERAQEVSNYYDRALEPLKKKEEEEKQKAIQDIERFIKDHPNSSKNNALKLSLAELYFDVDLRKTINLLEKTSNKTDAGYYLLGIAYLYEGEIPQAQKTLKYFLDQFPQSTYAEEVRFRLAETYFSEREYATAESYFHPILDNPQSSFYSKALYKSAWIKYLQNKYPEAIDEFTLLLNTGSGGSDILRQEAARYLAISYVDSHQYFPEIGKADWAPLVWMHLGNMLVKLEKKHEAVMAFQQVILLNPTDSKNQELELRMLELDPSKELKKNYLAKYPDSPSVLLDLAIQTHADKEFKEAAQDYALFINRFPEAENLDEVLFYYSESTFDAQLYHHAAIGFGQLRDWPWDTEYRQRAALNAVYATAQKVKQVFPDYDLSSVSVDQKGRFSGELPAVMVSYVGAIDALREKYPEDPKVPSLLFQSAGLYYAYGNLPEAKKRFESLIEFYPKQEPAKLAAHIMVSDSLVSEQWLEAAEQAKRYRYLSEDFGAIEHKAQFKHVNQLFSESKTPQEYEQVAELYLNILKQDPKTEFADKILFNAATALERSHRYQEADNLFETLYLTHPRSPLVADAKEQRALYFEQRLMFEKAASLYAAIPGNKQALLRAALDYEAAGKQEAAISLFKRFMKEYPDSPEIPDASRRVGKALSSASVDYARLESALKAYLGLKINAKSSKEQTKQLTHKAQKLADLQKSYEQLIANYEVSVWTVASIYQIGRLYEDLHGALMKAPCPQDVSKIDDAACDEYANLLEDQALVLEKKALDAYQLAVDKSANIPRSSDWVLLAKSGQYRMKPSEYMPAEALFEEPVIGLNYQLAISDGSNAEYELLKGNFKETEALAMTRLASEPFDLVARLQMARIFYAKKQYEAAQMTLEDSLEKDETSALSHLWLGHVYAAQGEIAKAIAAFEKADLPEAYDNLGLLYLDQGDLSKALSNLQKAAEAWPDFAPVQVHLGNYYFVAKDYPKARAQYETALKLDPKLTPVYLNLGLLAMTDKQYEDARVAFEAFLKSAKPGTALQNRVESYIKLMNQKIGLEKQRHEQNT
jgi:tetratricopeptide (TPR) repeat protein